MRTCTGCVLRGVMLLDQNGQIIDHPPTKKSAEPLWRKAERAHRPDHCLDVFTGVNRARGGRAVHGLPGRPLQFRHNSGNACCRTRRQSSAHTKTPVESFLPCQLPGQILLAHGQVPPGAAAVRELTFHAVSSSTLWRFWKGASQRRLPLSEMSLLKTPPTSLRQLMQLNDVATLGLICE